MNLLSVVLPPTRMAAETVSGCDRGTLWRLLLSSTLYVFGQVHVQKRLLVAMWLSA
jgi:hypothetical protein